MGCAHKDGVAGMLELQLDPNFCVAHYQLGCIMLGLDVKQTVQTHWSAMPVSVSFLPYTSVLFKCTQACQLRAPSSGLGPWLAMRWFQLCQMCSPVVGKHDH